MKVEIQRFDPDSGRHWTDAYEVDTSERSMTIMDVLDYISDHLDHTLAYYKHSACNHGICGRCTLYVNRKPKLACIELAGHYDSLQLAPIPSRTCVRDLIVR